MIKAVIFDFGGVLVRTHDWSGRQHLDEKFNLPPGGSYDLVFGDMSIKAQMGQITTRHLWDWIGAQLNLDSDQLAAFERDFFAGDVLDTKLINLIRGLKPDYQTALLSNAVDELRQILETNYQIAGAFDLIVCSAEEKVMKPDPEIYLRTLSRLGRRPDEAVFIDDALGNIEAAREVGMAVIHFNPQTDVVAELATLHVIVGGPQ